MKVSGKHYRSIWADADRASVHIIDQSRLPHVFETLRIDSAEAMAEAIKAMRLRGAPLIGVAAAYGIALAMVRATTDASISKASELLRALRWLTASLGLALVAAEAVVGARGIIGLYAALAGTSVLLLSLLPGVRRHAFAGGWRSLF